MNKIKNLFVIILFALVAFSCSDILDKGPLDKYSENDVWKSTDLTQAFIYTALANATNMMVWKDNWTDNEAIMEDGRDVNAELIDRYYDAGWNKYEDIRRCNMVVGTCSGSTLYDAEKAYFIAQAKTIRAMIYFTRARLFGKLMLVKELIDPEADMKFPRTATVKETYDFILNDLREAAPDLPVDAPSGALSRGVAYALLGEAALHGAAYIENGQEEYYRIAAKACEDLFALDKYSLDGNYAGMFNDYDHSLASSEIILAQWRSAENTNFSDTWMQRLVPNIDPSKLIADVQAKYPLVEEMAGWPQRFPSVDLVNDYLVVDEDGKAKEWDQTSYYKKFLVDGGTVEELFTKNRVNDSKLYRLRRMFLFLLIGYGFVREVIFIILLKTTEFWGMPVSGYVYRKCVYEAKRLLNSEKTDYHYTLLRLGRSYLNYAEIKLRQGDKETGY